MSEAEDAPLLEIAPRPGTAARLVFLAVLLIGSGLTYASGWPGLLLVGLAPVTWLIAILRRPRWLRLYEDGVEVSTYWEPSFRMAFGDVRSVFRHPVRPWFPSVVVLVDEEHCRLPIPAVAPGIEALITAVERACIRPVLREASAALRDGDRLYFGPIAIDRNGFTLRGRDIPWGAVDTIEAAGHVLRLEGHTGRIDALPVEQLPFPTVLVQLLRELDLEVELTDEVFLLQPTT